MKSAEIRRQAMRNAWQARNLMQTATLAPDARIKAELYRDAAGLLSQASEDCKRLATLATEQNGVNID